MTGWAGLSVVEPRTTRGLGAVDFVLLFALFPVLPEEYDPGTMQVAATRFVFLATLVLGCVSAEWPAGDPGPLRYRLAHSGDHWDVVGDDRVLEDLEPRYPAFFELILDPNRFEEPDLRPLRADLERVPVDRRNFDALNAIAIGYFEINFRGEAMRGQLSFMSQGYRAAKLVSVPWRAFQGMSDETLRDATVDFFADAVSGEKLGTQMTRGRLLPILESLERKEEEPTRKSRLHDLSQVLQRELETATQP